MRQRARNRNQDYNGRIANRQQILLNEAPWKLSQPNLKNDYDFKKGNCTKCDMNWYLNTRLKIFAFNI